MSLPDLANTPFMRLPRGRMFVPRGAPHTAGLRGLWVVPQGPDYNGKFIPNLIDPGFYLERTDSSGTGEPTYHPTNAIDNNQSRGLMGNKGIVVSGSAFGNYGRATTPDQPDFPWKPATAGGHQPATIAVMWSVHLADAAAAFAVSNRLGTDGRPFIGFRLSDFAFAGQIYGSTLVEVAMPFFSAVWAVNVAVFTSRSQTDHELVTRIFGDGQTIGGVGGLYYSTSSTDCGAAAADATTVTVAGRAGGTAGSSARYTALASWFWDRGMTRQEMEGFLYNPFAMIREQPAGLSLEAQAGGGGSGDDALLTLMLGSNWRNLANGTPPLIGRV